jgi:nitrogen fixation NifU-like protein
MPDADGKGSYGDPACGDYLTIYIKVKKDIIEEISYLVFGCSAAIATSSMTSVIVRGKSLSEAMLLTENDIVQALEGLPESKQHCSNLGISALRNAIKDFKEKNRNEGKKDEDSYSSR